MKRIQFFIALTVLIGILSCEDSNEQVYSRIYPSILSGQTKVFAGEGVEFNAEFSYRGNFEIIEYGFVWSEDEVPRLGFGNVVSETRNIPDEPFSLRAERYLASNVKYNVLPYIKTKDHTVFGNPTSFESLGSKAPEITSIIPSTGTVGDTIIIQGKNMGQIGNNLVKFGNEEATVISESDSLISVIVPYLDESEALVSNTVSQNVGLFNDTFLVSIPEIYSVSKGEVNLNDTLIIKGANFSYMEDQNKVSLNGKELQVISHSKTELSVVIPYVPVKDITITVEVSNQSVSYYEVDFLSPQFLQVSNSLWLGDTIKIVGKNLAQYENEISIILDNNLRTPFSFSNDTIKVLFYDYQTIADINLTVGFKNEKVIDETIFIKEPLIYEVTPNEFSSFPLKFEIKGRGFENRAKVTITDPYGMEQLVTGDTGHYNISGEIRSENRLNQTVRGTDSVTLTIQNTNFSKTIAVNFEAPHSRVSQSEIEYSRGSVVLHQDGDKVLIGLGENSELWEYSISENKWREKNGGSLGNTFGGTASSNDEVWAFMGFKNNAFSRQVWRYDINGDAWNQKKDFPGSCKDCGGVTAFSHNGDYYVAATDSLIENRESKKKVWKYDAGSDQWAFSHKLPMVTYESTSAISDGNYVYFLTSVFSKPFHSNRPKMYRASSMDGNWIEFFTLEETARNHRFYMWDEKVTLVTSNYYYQLTSNGNWEKTLNAFSGIGVDHHFYLDGINYFFAIEDGKLSVWRSDLSLVNNN